MRARPLAIAALAALALLLGACGASSDDPVVDPTIDPTVDTGTDPAPPRMTHPPSEQLVREAVAIEGCVLVSIQAISWPDDSYRIPADYSDAQVTYEGDCLFDGWTKPQRIIVEAQFAARPSAPGASTRTWVLMHNQPVEPIAPQGHVARTPSEIGPACAALLEQVERRVRPCVERIDPAAARRIGSWHEAASREARWSGGDDGPEAQARRIDEACLASWRSYMAPDFRGSSPFRACAPD